MALRVSDVAESDVPGQTETGGDVSAAAILISNVLVAVLERAAGLRREPGQADLELPWAKSASTVAAL